MPLREAIRMALATVRAQKLKSFFPLIGVLIGVQGAAVKLKHQLGDFRSDGKHESGSSL